MKPYDPHIEPQHVIAILAQCGIEVDEDQAALLARHAALVLEYNKHTNLTRIVEPEAVLELHIADSLAFLEHVDALEGSLVDLGSGAGYPGIPLAIVGHQVLLCESSKKKAAFLAEATKQLGLQCEVVALRAEELALSSPRSFDVVVARAVASLPALVELAAPLLGPGGRLIAMKGRPETAEREQALRVGTICGMEESTAAQYELPLGEQRSVYAYTKSGRAKLALPRRPGMAQRQTLGAAGT